MNGHGDYILHSAIPSPPAQFFFFSFSDVNSFISGHSLMINYYYIIVRMASGHADTVSPKVFIAPNLSCMQMKLHTARS